MAYLSISDDHRRNHLRNPCTAGFRGKLGDDGADQQSPDRGSQNNDVPSLVNRGAKEIIRFPPAQIRGKPKQVAKGYRQGTGRNANEYGEEQ
jgi:hypothetical protein